VTIRQQQCYFTTASNGPSMERSGQTLYCTVSIHLYSAARSAHQPEARPVRDPERRESLEHRCKKRWPQE